MEALEKRRFGGELDNDSRCRLRRVMATPRKTCSDCGKRGNWPKQLIGDQCEECVAERRRHDAILQDFREKCTGHARVEGQSGAARRLCDPENPPVCASCTEYFNSEDHRYFVKRYRL